MIPKKLPADILLSSPYNKNLIKIISKDEILILINKLSSLFKNFTKILKNNITQKKEILSLIDNKIQYAHKIVNNIVKHNYSFDQLKSLNETLVHIKEKTNGSKINILDEEQNLIIFFEESEKIFKTIIDKQKNKLENNANNNKKKINSKSPNQINMKYNFDEYYFLNKSRNLKKNKSQGNKKKQENTLSFSQRNNPNETLCEKYNIYKNINNDTQYNMSINTINEKNAKSIINSPYKTKSKINSDFNSEKKNNDNNLIKNINLIDKYELLKKKNFCYEKCIQSLNKKIDYYKNLLYKNQTNKEINSKTTQVSISSHENEIFKNINNKNLFKNLNNKNLKNNININKKKLANINNNSQIVETEGNNTFYSFNNTINGKNCSMNILQKEKEIIYLKQEKTKMEKIIKEQRNKRNIIEKENSIINKKNIEFNEKIKELEKSIKKSNDELKKEINKNEELNNLCQNQKIKFEYEISVINDKRTELSKLIANKNNEIIKLQKELVIKNKEFEEHKMLKKKDFENNDKNDNVHLNNELNKSTNQYENGLSNKNDKINNIHIINTNKININNLQNIEMIQTEITKLKKENENLNRNNNNLNEVIKKIKDENEGLKEFAIKIKNKEEIITEENIQYKEKISTLQKENNTYKQYFKDKNNNSQDLNKKKIKNEDNNNVNILLELNEAKKEINNLKKKNEQLFNELESKKFVNQFCDNFSEGKAISNYEEEFDLKKMAKGAMDKNRSQDINIDYPGAQQVKEKYRELDFYYNSLEDLVKKLLLNCTCTNKNKVYVSELCKIVGFDEDVSNKIINNKSKKGLLNMFG